MILRVLIASLLLGTLASAQTPAPTALIDRLVANADRYRATLPSLTADESIVTGGFGVSSSISARRPPAPFASSTAKASRWRSRGRL